MANTTTQPDAAQQILSPVSADNSVKADAWEAFNSSKDENELTQKLQSMNLPNNTKADLWEAKKRSGTASVGGQQVNLKTGAGAEQAAQGQAQQVAQRAPMQEEPASTNTMIDAATMGVPGITAVRHPKEAAAAAGIAAGGELVGAGIEAAPGALRGAAGYSGAAAEGLESSIAKEGASRAVKAAQALKAVIKDHPYISTLVASHLLPKDARHWLWGLLTGGE